MQLSNQGKELLKALFKYTVKKSSSRECIRCKSKTWRLDRHHVIYKPAHIVLLCRSCHASITTINSIAAIVLKTKLTNEIRLQLWKWFLTFQGWATEQDVAKILGVNYTFTIEDHIRFAKRRKLHYKKLHNKRVISSEFSNEYK